MHRQCHNVPTEDMKIAGYSSVVCCEMSAAVTSLQMTSFLGSQLNAYSDGKVVPLSY